MKEELRGSGAPQLQEPEHANKMDTGISSTLETSWTDVSVPRSIPNVEAEEISKTNDSAEYVIINRETSSPPPSEWKGKGKAIDLGAQKFHNSDSRTNFEHVDARTDSWPNYSVTSYYDRSSSASCSASLANELVGSNDLLDFLAIVQHRRIDLLPFQWEVGESLGRGGTANIFSGGSVETSEGHNLSFAFKRFQREGAGHQEDASKVYQALLSEVYVLGHPVVRQHPNVNALQGVCWDVVYDEPWPVLVFKKTEYGDLKQFMKTPEGRGLSFTDKINLCWDIGNAIELMHACHSVHGDLKPDNILIFKDPTGKFSAKVTDFGYSVIFAQGNEDVLITLPYSWPWTAPEVEEDCHVTLKIAKEADIFSYGLICYWLLCYDMLPRDKTKGEDFPAPSYIDGLKKDPELISLVEKDIKVVTDELDMLSLSWFFDLSLSQRTLKIDSLPMPVGKKRKPLPLMEEYGKSALLRTKASFNLVTLLSQFRMCRRETKKAVFRLLEKRANEHPDPIVRGNSAYDLALCYTIGFAVRPSKKESEIWLEKAGRPHQDLEDAIEMLKADTSSLYHGINAKVDYFDAARPKKRGLRTPIPVSDPADQGDSDTEILISPTDEDVLVMGATAAWVHKMLGMNPGEIRMLINNDAPLESETSKQQLNDLTRDQFGWEDGGSMSTKISFTLNRDSDDRDEDEDEMEVPEKQLSPTTVDQTLPITEKLRSPVEENHQPKTLEEEIAQTRNSIDKKIKVIGPEHEDTLRDMEKLSQLYFNLEKWDEIEILETSILSTRQNILGTENPATLRSMEKLIGALMLKGFYKESEHLVMELFEIRKRVLGIKHEDTLKSLKSLDWLNKRYMENEMSDDVLPLLEKIVEIEKEAYGSEDKRTLWNMRSLALIYATKQRYEESEKILQQIIRATEKSQGNDNEDMIESLQLLVGLYTMQMLAGPEDQGNFAQKVHQTQMRIENIKYRVADVKADESHHHDGHTHALDDEEEICEHRRDTKQNIKSMGDLVLDYLHQRVSTEEVDKNIKKAEEALENLDDDAPERTHVLAMLANGYVSRFRHLNDIDDLDTGIMWAEQALLVVPEDHSERAPRADELGTYFWQRYEARKSPEDLDSAINYAQESVQSTDGEGTELTQRMEDLAMRLKERYDQGLNIDDLDTAIMWAEQAEQATHAASDESRRKWWLVLLSSWNNEKYKRLGDLDSISNAISALERIEEGGISLDLKTQVQMYDELSDLYEERFCKFTTEPDPSDLNKCVWKSEQSANLARDLGDDGPTISGDKPHGILLMKMAWKYYMRFMVMNEPEDLEEASVSIEQAAQLVPDGSRNRERLDRIRSQILGSSNRVAQGRHAQMWRV